MVSAVTIVFGLMLSVGAVNISPVTRVVELLQGLSKQVEKEGEVEEGLYETFVCWGKTIINQKTASNEVASSRIAELNTYIADLDSGRIELTSERTDLEKDISELMNDMDTAKNIREKEEQDFNEASAEMSKAIDALEDARGVLHQATKGNKGTVLLAVRQSLQGAAENGGMAKFEAHQARLNQAAELGERFLNKADATFLKRVLLGQVPKITDNKKTNRKATFKMAYGTRSTKIQGVLQKMHETFKLNLAEAVDQEKTAVENFETLSGSKEKQLDATRDALSKMASENGEKGLSKDESENEVERLTKQVSDDHRFIAQTIKALEEKKKSWQVRSDLRANELAAISKAISILANDDSRDLFKKSFASQDSFLQIRQTAHQRASSQKKEQAVVALKQAASRSGDKRLLALAQLSADAPSEKDKFAPILASIDSMVTLLQEEEKRDLETKQTCEDDRMEQTRTTIVESRKIDDNTDLINKLARVIQECNTKIAEIEKERASIKKARKEAKVIREREHADWLVNNKDDKEASDTVLEAANVLRVFYKETGMVFAQTGTKMGSRDAPPPPPATWDADLAPHSGEATGIVAVLEMVREDIDKDRQDAKTDEKNSSEDYEAFRMNAQANLDLLKEERDENSAQAGRASSKKDDVEFTRRESKKHLDATMETINAINPNCEYFEVNYPMRVSNRHIEVDGLQKAKAILSGGTFDALPDPNREMNVGDAASSALFLQKKKSA